MSRLRFFEDSQPTETGSKNPVFVPSGQEKNDDGLDDNYKLSARYRCEQFNTTKVEDHITFHCDTKKQYLLKLTPGRKAQVVLEQYLYKVNPPALKDAIAATEKLEFDKENVAFGLHADNSIKSVNNFAALQQKWNQFKPELINSELYRTIGRTNPAAAEGLIQGGDLEFGTEDVLLKTYDKSLFYHTIFNDFDPEKDRESKQQLEFNSQIFVNVPLELELTHGVINDSERTTEVMTVGKLNKGKLNEDTLIQQYNQFYKPIIEYDFTEYIFEYIIRRTVDKNSGLILSATVQLKEAVKYNYEFVTQFDLKKLED
ncbi:hypothetical protein ABDD95_22925 [Mucilaginibacter sp. PAMB04274]|uniref:hypothetical protein n=1 Tax=Mucilaginibacter sp. PAMB04274 TaxID=3138568 RepID=UPI0031F6DDF6